MERCKTSIFISILGYREWTRWALELLEEGMIAKKILIKIFTIFWKKRLLNYYYSSEQVKVYDEVIKVKRWNSAITDSKAGQRQTVVFLRGGEI